MALGQKFSVKPKYIRGLFKASANDVVEVDDSEFPSLSNRTFKMQVQLYYIRPILILILLANNVQNPFLHGLRTPNEAFFSVISRTFELGQMNSWKFRVFSVLVERSAPILVQ